MTVCRNTILDAAQLIVAVVGFLTPCGPSCPLLSLPKISSGAETLGLSGTKGTNSTNTSSTIFNAD